jgi:hypothetical protein
VLISSDQCTCKFICLSALHAPRYIQYLLQKFCVRVHSIIFP